MTRTYHLSGEELRGRLALPGREEAYWAGIEAVRSTIRGPLRPCRAPAPLRTRFWPSAVPSTAHDVRYLIFGSIAGVLHGADLRTIDVDIVPEPSAANLERVASALNALQPRPRRRASRGTSPPATGPGLSVRWTLPASPPR